MMTIAPWRGLGFPILTVEHVAHNVVIDDLSDVVLWIL